MAENRELDPLVENRSVSNIFEEENPELLEYFAAQAAVSFDNAMLNEELEARVETHTAELERTSARFQELAFSDPLTAVFNHHHFYDLGKQELVLSQRYGHLLSI